MGEMYKKMASCVVASLLVLASLSFAPVSLANAYDSEGLEPTGGEMAFDAMARPIMVVGTLVTTALFLVSLPFSLLGGNASEAANNLVVEPFKYTFLRPLGER